MTNRNQIWQEYSLYGSLPYSELFADENHNKTVGQMCSDRLKLLKSSQKPLSQLNDQ